MGLVTEARSNSGSGPIGDASSQAGVPSSPHEKIPSDVPTAQAAALNCPASRARHSISRTARLVASSGMPLPPFPSAGMSRSHHRVAQRSEERRVGKEGAAGWAQEHTTTNTQAKTDQGATESDDP